MQFATLRLEPDPQSTQHEDRRDPDRAAVDATRRVGGDESRRGDSPTLDSLRRQLRGVELEQFSNPGCE